MVNNGFGFLSFTLMGFIFIFVVVSTIINAAFKSSLLSRPGENMAFILSSIASFILLDLLTPALSRIFLGKQINDLYELAIVQGFYNNPVRLSIKITVMWNRLAALLVSFGISPSLTTLINTAVFMGVFLLGAGYFVELVNCLLGFIGSEGNKVMIDI